jgi:hypothetical protein
MNGEGITLSFQKFLEVTLLILNCSFLLKLYALLVTNAHSKY